MGSCAASVQVVDLAVLAEPDRAHVERLLALSPALATVRDLAQHFGAMVRTRSVDALIPWLADAEKGDLRGFAAGLHQDEQGSTCSGRTWSMQPDNDLHRGCG